MRLALSFFLSALCLAKAEAFQATAEADRDSVPLNGALSLTLTVQYEGKKPESLIFPGADDFPGFHARILGQARSQSIKIINGQIRQNRAIKQNYLLHPKAKGVFHLKSLSVKINGKIHKANPLSITVTENKAGASPPNFPAAPSFPGNSFLQNPASPSDPFNPFSLWPFRRQAPSTPHPPARIQSHLNKSSVYKGEMTEAKWILLSSSENIQTRPEKRPVLEGFWREETKKSLRGGFLGTEVIDGALYRKILLEKLILFPLEAGELRIDPYAVKISAFSGFRFHEQTVSSPPIKMRVKPLPEEGRGLFSGAVGKFQVKASLSEKDAQTGRPLSYYLRFEGAGHPRFIKLPPVPFPDSVRAYPPAEKSEFSPDGLSWKKYEILIAPKKAGVLKIPSFELTTFDPEQERYITHTIPSFSISARAADKKEEESERFFEALDQSQDRRQSLDQSQRLAKIHGRLKASPAKTKWLERLNSKSLLQLWLAFYLSLAAAIIGLCLAPHLLKNKPSLKEDMEERQRQIESLIEKKDWQRAAVRLISLTYFALRKGGGESGSANWQELIKNLPPSLRQKYGKRLRGLMEELESLSFAPLSLPKEKALAKIKELAEESKKILPHLPR